MEVRDSEDDADDQDDLLQQGVSVVVTRGNWVSEQYVVHKKFITDILMRLNCGTPMVDAFATAKNKRWAQHWGTDKPDHPDAFDEDWSFEVQGLIWANPPFSKLEQVVNKAKHNKVRIVLICPEWHQQQWFKDAMSITHRRYRYKAGTPFFELNGRPAGGTHWAVWALYINSTSDKQHGHNKNTQEFQLDIGDQRTTSSRRRDRPRRLEKAQG